MTEPTIVSVKDVSKRFVLHKDKSLKERIVNFRSSRRHRDDFWALRNVDLEVPLGSTVGLVGHNGSGKSTLLKVIGGILEPSSGTVARRGRLAALLELGAGFHQDLTGRENVYLNAAILGLSRKDTDRYFDAIVDFSGIESFIDTQVKFYSSGMYVRLAFAVAVHVDPDLLLVDEVLAVGDEPFQRKCMEKIAQFQSEGRTIVLVSHSADQVGSLCDRTVVLHAGEIQHDGDTAEGLRVLRAGYEEDRRVAATIAADGRAEYPYMFNSVDSRTTVADGRIDVDIDVDVEIIEPLPGWGIGISIETPLGLRLFEVTTFDLGSELPTERGSHRLTITLPDVRLGTGKYIVNLGLGDRTGRNFDQAPGATSFDVPVLSPGAGTLRVQPLIRAD
ncbi:ABC transporter ATP-binding protein [Agromyces aurantiacus]|uniref:ABC transporter ATP-binding protein n=1 Tax=Agromyces aurantiacus TaxID=165814 RepID=A0ABV9R859_9MICO|nr:ABC transporter ATP-binding protein [Agromyces aurantiacus]MBM7504146.1 ABC-2 type transport system ATP-binding protein [Agromyces aurantiacus]